MDQFLEGFLLQASLILALGAQNIFVLESGLKKRRQLLVATTCSVCDAFLIAIGVFGAASIFVEYPYLKVTFGLLGVLFLAFYGIKKIQESLNYESKSIETSDTSHSFKKVVALSLGFSILNPHVYLDTIVLIGGFATKYHEISERAVFGMGAASFSTIWFFGLAIFAQGMSSILNNQRSMRMVSLISGIILLVLTIKLGHDVYGWLV